MTVPEVDLRILCGCPMDSIKHLRGKGFVKEKERDGFWYETGPNAILLSDTSMQNGDFANLSEFPILHMWYKQGMIIPKHPNNTGRKPLLIGLPEQVAAQSEYVFRGNYGLPYQDELREAGFSAEEAEEFLRMKRRFANDNIKEPDALFDQIYMDKDVVEIASGLFLRRKGLNRYEFIYQGESIETDLNLPLHRKYDTPYRLDFHKTRRQYFSVIHIGEGDGWDVSRPCMGSLLTFQGKIYLIDAGPGILASLTALGISVNEIEGIFHTHSHDDHFAGLTTLVRSDHRIKYYATPLVRQSVVRKLTALMSIEEEMFYQSFDVHDLAFNSWNNIDGLEVQPLLSPHPVETSILFFRTFWRDGYRTYAHLADIVSLRFLERMIEDDPEKSGVSRAFYNRVKEQYLTKVDIKKIDIGGMPIHGMAEDFAQDPSDKIVLSHTSRELTVSEKEIGSNAVFGMEDLLIEARQDYSMQGAFYFLHAYFPKVPTYELHRLTNCPTVHLNVGTILIHKGSVNRSIYLVLSGVVEFLDAEKGVNHIISSGALVGELSGFAEEPASGTYRAASYITALEIPCGLYVDFIRRNDLFFEVRQVSENRKFLQETWLFGEMVSYRIQNEIARCMTLRSCREEDVLSGDNRKNLYLLADGGINLFYDSRIIETLVSGNFFGEEMILGDGEMSFDVRAAEPSEYYVIPARLLEEIPIVQWKLLETYQKRVRAYMGQYEFEWRDEYSMNVPELDEHHKEIFAQVNQLYKIWSRGENGIFDHHAEKLLGYMEGHFQREEVIMEEKGFPELACQKKAHAGLRKDFLHRLEAVRQGAEGRQDGEGRQKEEPKEEPDSLQKREDPRKVLLDFLRDWLVRHTLGEDRRMRPFAGHI